MMNTEEVKFDHPSLSNLDGGTSPEAGTVAQLGNAEEAPNPENDWQKVFAQFSNYISLDVITSVFEQYKQLIVVILLFLGAIIAVKITLAVLEVVHEIPLLAPFLELIGIAYSTWFTYRYLWKAENRSELVQDFNKIKSQVLGQSI